MAAAKKEEGNRLFASKDYDGAIRAYSEAIELEPDNHIFYSNRSLAHGGNKDWEKAAADARTCIQKAPTFVKGYYRLASAQVELQQYDVATNTIKQGFEHDSANAELNKLMRIVKAKKASAAAAARRSASGQPARQMDESTRKEASELSDQLQTASRELNETLFKLQNCKREQKRAELTATEVGALEETTPVYRSVGKMFLLSSKPDIQKHLGVETESHQKMEADLAARKTYLERKINSLQLNMRDLIGSAAA